MNNPEKRSVSQQSGESAIATGCSAEVLADLTQVMTMATAEYVASGNEIYEQFQDLKRNEFEIDHRFSSESARCASFTAFRQQHYDSPLEVLREECARKAMAAFERHLDGINFPTE